MSIVTEWPEDEVARFQTGLVRLKHRLAERASFSDEGLTELLDRYPREAMGVFTMDAASTDWRSWRRGTAHGLSGVELLAAVKAGRLWLNLRHANRRLTDFGELADEIAAEKEAAFKTKIMNRDLGVLISSPNARVLYHLDVPLSSLWQVRGEKRIWFYPCEAPFVDPAWLERCVHGLAEGQMPFEPQWDERAETLRLTPGDMITWPQNLPHRVDNGPMLNVSVSMEYMTPPARVRANVLHANGVLRQALGASPKVQARLGPTMAAKLLLSVLHKKATDHGQRSPVLAETFKVDAAKTAQAV
jgi:hypothetical protein